MVNWIRSRAARREEPPAQQCTGCRVAIPGASDDELRASGGTFLEAVGWFCGPRCERQYRLRFRIQPANTPLPAPASATPPGGSRTSTPPPVEAVSAGEPSRPPAADALAAALRARRRRHTGGV